MRNAWTIAVREFKSYLSSFMGYAVIAGFLLVSGFLHVAVILHLNEASMRISFHNMSVILLLVVPVITMRLFSEEKRLRTIELLMSSPVTEAQAVLGKYIGALLFLLVMLAPTLSYYGFLEAYGDPDRGAIFAGYVGIFLLGAVFISFGLLTSALTSNQVAAAVMAFAVLLLLWVIEWISGRTGGSISEFLSYISVYHHLDDFMRGVLDSRGIFYYLSLIFLCLYGTSRIIYATKWRVG